MHIFYFSIKLQVFYSHFNLEVFLKKYSALTISEFMAGANPKPRLQLRPEKPSRWLRQPLIFINDTLLCFLWTGEHGRIERAHRLHKQYRVRAREGGAGSQLLRRSDRKTLGPGDRRDSAHLPSLLAR